MDIEEAKDKFSKQFLIPNSGVKGVFGIGIGECDVCKGERIVVSIENGASKELISSIPHKFEGYNIKKIFGEMPVAQTTNSSSTSAESLYPNGHKATKIQITKRGISAINTAPITGGYIPENIYILLMIKDGKVHEVSKIKKSRRRLANADGLIKYLEAKTLLVTN